MQQFFSRALEWSGATAAGMCLLLAPALSHGAAASAPASAPASRQASAPTTAELPERILSDIAHGRNPRGGIDRYLSATASQAHGSPYVDRGQEVRQLRAAQADLINALQSSAQAESLAGIYSRWHAALILVQNKFQSVQTRLQSSSDGAAYVGRNSQIRDQVLSTANQVVALLDAAFARDANGAFTLTAAQQRPSLQQALALLRAAPTVKTDPAILRASNLPAGPVSLPVHQPVLTPNVVPSYATQTEISLTPDDSADSVDAPLSQEISDQATALGNDYVRIYEYVRNQTRTEWYAGSAKGAVGVLRSGAGNDVDQASLLLALLRAAGVPGRYVHGVVSWPVAQLATDLGLSDINQVPAFLSKAGIPFSPVNQGGKLAAVQVVHTWVSAYVPYSNYRGAFVDASGKTWLPLDASYKHSTWRAAGTGMSQAGTAAQLSKAYLADPTLNVDLLGYVQQQVQNALNTAGGGEYAQQPAVATVTPLSLSLLPNTLPYNVLAVNSESPALADADRVTAHIVIRKGNTPSDAIVLDRSFPVADIGNRRFTLSYSPASIADHRLMLLFGGMDLVPLYLINLRPQLRLDGEVTAVATDPVSPGTLLRVEVTLQSPAGTAQLAQTVLAGAYQAVSIAQSPTRPATDSAGSQTEPRAGALLDGIAVAYARRWSSGEDELGGLLDTRTVHPLPTVTLVGNAMRTDSIGGEPYTLSWQGVTVDAALHPLEAVGARSQDVLALAALHGSSLEHVVFKDNFDADSISADRGLAVANANGTPILSLDRSNIASLDATPHAASVKNAVANLVNAGYRVDIPNQQIQYQSWSGSTWRATDPASGAAGYFISGGLAGGSTAVPGGVWTLDFLADALRDANSDPNNSDPLSGAAIYKLGVADAQIGTVGQPVGSPLGVMVVDKAGLPVKGATVHFAVSTGGGQIDGGSTEDVTTDALGVAQVSFTPGTKTNLSPVYMQRNPADKFVTRAGLNQIDAAVTTRKGLLRIDSPFTAIGMPDKQANLRQTSVPVSTGIASMWADTVTYVVEDQYQNPIANVSGNFGASTQIGCNFGDVSAYKPGAVFEVRKGMPGACSGVPTLGDCGGASLSTMSDSNGAVSAGVLMSNTLDGTTTVTANIGNFNKQTAYKGLGSCGTPDGNAEYAVSLNGSQLVDENGNPVAAALPYSPIKPPVNIQVRATNWPYKIVNGKAVFAPFVTWQPADGTVNATMPQGGAVTSTSRVGTGSYQASVSPGGLPGKYQVAANANIPVTTVANTSSGVQIQTTNLTTNGTVATVYAVKPKIQQVQSDGAPSGQSTNHIFLGVDGTSTYPVQVQYTIDPSDYNALSADMDFTDNGNWIGYEVGNSRKGTGAAYVPRSTQFDITHQYQAQLVLNRGGDIEVRADQYTLPLREQLILNFPTALSMSRQIDVENQRVCDVGTSVAFAFTQDVTATLKYVSLGDDGSANGGETELFSGKSYSAGSYSYDLLPENFPAGNYQLTLVATSVNDAGAQETRDAELKSRYTETNNLPVGQTIVKGVNVRNGMLTARSLGFSLQGRGPDLDFTPTYSSGGNGAIGVMGANWSHSMDAGIQINSCGEVMVDAGDGGSLRFFPQTDGSLKPDKGYHGTLIANATDHSFDFYSKDGTRYHFTFMSAGSNWKLAFVEDSNGNRSTYTWDLNATPEPRVTQVTDANKRTVTFKYTDVLLNSLVKTSNHQHSFPMVSEVDGPDGIQLLFEHDEYGNLTKVTRTGSPTKIETFSYHTDAPEWRQRTLMKTAVDPNGNSTGYTFNSQSMKLQNGAIVINMPYVFVSEVQTPLGKVGFSIDTVSWNNTTVTDEDGHTTQYTLNAHGSPLSIADAAGTTKMSWSNDDVVMLGKVDGRGVTTSYGYDVSGNMTSEFVGGFTQSWSYMLQTAPPYIKNRMLSHTDRNSQTYAYSYDGKGNKTQEKNPDGGVIQHTYLGNGDRSSTTDAMHGVTRYTYDSWGYVDTVTDPIGAVSKEGHDERGRTIVRQDGNGNSTTYAYDGQDNLVSQTDAKGGSKSHTYDANGNKLTEKDEAGHSTGWSYNAINLVTQATNAKGDSKTYTYDPVGNKTGETDWLGNATSYQYDGANRLTLRTEPLGKKTQYAYDEVGNVLTETDALGNATTHKYDDLSRRKQTTDTAGGNWAFTFDGNGNRLSQTDPLNRLTQSKYDPMNRLVESDEPLNRTLKYTYDFNGNKTGETDALNQSTQHGYDLANRLIRTIDPLNQQTTREYDKVGNLTKLVDANLGTLLYTYDALNRKVSQQDQEKYVTSYGYDAVGNLTQETQPNGNTITHAYDVLNHRTSTNDLVGAAGTWSYDSNSNLLTEADGNGNTSTHGYNALNQRISSQLPEGRKLSFKYDLLSNRTQATDARSNATGYVYDKLNRLTETDNALGGKLLQGYDAVGNKVSSTDANGNATSYQYDDLNRLTQITDPLSKTNLYSYDLNGNRTSETDKRGIVTTHKYDALNRLLVTTKAGLAIRGLTYDGVGNVLFEADAAGNKVGYEYDKRNLRTAENRLLAAITHYKRDSMGDVTLETDPEGRKTSHIYDQRRRLTSSTNAAGETTSQSYDLANNKLGITHPLGNADSFQYDTANRMVLVTDAVSTTKYGYDTNSNHTDLTDGNGHHTSYAYDALNRRTSVNYPDGATESFGYDANGNLLTHTDANGTVITRGYDALNRDTSQAFSRSNDGLSGVTTGYDANNNVLSVIENYGSGTFTTTNGYDDFDRLQTRTDPYGTVAQYSYDANGNRTRLLTQPDGRITNYSYDVLNRLTQINGQGGVDTFAYDRSSLLLTQAAITNSINSVYSYDLGKRVSTVTHGKSGAPFNSTSYQYDKNGNRLQEKVNRPTGAQLTTYTFDAADRLTGTTVADANQSSSTGYSYDAVGNRLTENVSTTVGATTSSLNKTYSYNTRSQLTGITVQDSTKGNSSITLSYDPQGNLTSKTSGADTTVYTYDGRDQLISIARNGTPLGQYRNNADGYRVEKNATVNGVTQQFHTYWDGVNALQDTDATGLLARYDFAGHNPIGMWQRDQGAQQLAHDALGSIIATTDATGTVQSETLYDAWGNPTLKVGSSANKFGYTGHQMDGESGLIYFKARYYDPEIGRFITQDPAAGKDEEPLSYQKYLYAYANPTVYEDLDGYENSQHCYGDPGTCDTRTDEEKERDHQANFELRKREALKKRGSSDPFKRAEQQEAEQRESDKAYSKKQITQESDNLKNCNGDQDCRDIVQQHERVGDAAHTTAKVVSKAGDAIEDWYCFKGVCAAGAGVIGRAGKLAHEVKVLEQEIKVAEKAGAEKSALAELYAKLKGLLSKGKAEAKTEAKAEGATANANKPNVVRKEEEEVIGGPHRETSKPVNDGCDSHHCPAKDAYKGAPISSADGPAIKMKPEDHRKTASSGSSDEAVAYRAQQRELLKQGKLDEAIDMDVQDIRSKFGNKYDKEIKQMLKYAKTLDPKDFISK
ncbi:RHS repeat-associated core domain-containing protein [Andreprevotia chitinilytica]|uniref:RHS repeat-associated core domain-containing protein n=1 Tax=Andreprevotia chitinilytica TaxID=396808 RepID=UPI00146FD082|nr:RHS repeat-associated core domain-containing protein [Andreprevotia chitinilytica]